MEAIKKSMLQMKKEQEKAQDKSDAMEEVYKVAHSRMTKLEEEVDDLKKNLAVLEADYAQCQDDLAKANKNLEDKEAAVTEVC